MSKFFIGIDPDVDASGVAVIQGEKINLSNMRFCDLYEHLRFYRERVVKPTVYVECGYLNQSNWHKVRGGSAALNAKIGNRTGANHEVARKIVEICKYFDIPFVEVRPTGSKLKANIFKQVTGIAERTNQEQRDALMLIWGR